MGAAGPRRRRSRPRDLTVATEHRVGAAVGVEPRHVLHLGGVRAVTAADHDAAVGVDRDGVGVGHPDPPADAVRRVERARGGHLDHGPGRGVPFLLEGHQCAAGSRIDRGELEVVDRLDAELDRAVVVEAGVGQSVGPDGSQSVRVGPSEGGVDDGGRRRDHQTIAFGCGGEHPGTRGGGAEVGGAGCDAEARQLESTRAVERGIGLAVGVQSDDGDDIRTVVAHRGDPVADDHRRRPARDGTRKGAGAASAVGRVDGAA